MTLKWIVSRSHLIPTTFSSHLKLKIVLILLFSFQLLKRLFFHQASMLPAWRTESFRGSSSFVLADKLVDVYRVLEGIPEYGKIILFGKNPKWVQVNQHHCWWCLCSKSINFHTFQPRGMIVWICLLHIKIKLNDATIYIYSSVIKFNLDLFPAWSLLRSVSFSWNQHFHCTAHITAFRHCKVKYEPYVKLICLHLQ